MSKIKTVVSALVAALAVSVVAVASASALTTPEFWQAGKPIAEGAKIKFTGTSGKTTIKTAKQAIECQTATGAGEISGPTLVTHATLKLTKCKSGAVACKSTKPLGEAEEIVTKSSKGSLVYLKAAKGLPAGLHLEPEEQPVTEFECGGLVKGALKNSLICEVAPVNTEVETGESVCKENAEKNGQQWNKIEGGGVIFELEALGEKAWLVCTDALKVEGKVEIKA